MSLKLKIVLIVLSIVFVISSVFGLLYAFNGNFKSSVNKIFNVDDFKSEVPEIDYSSKISLLEQSLLDTNQKLFDTNKELEKTTENLKISREESYNTNLIINGDFQIYQRGSVLKRVGVDTYTADHWLLMNGDGQLKLAESTLTCTDTEGFPSILCQWVETAIQSMWNETVTLSATIDGVRYSGTFTLPKHPKEDFIFNVIVTENFAFRLYEKKINEKMGVQFVVNPGVTISIHNVKLEFSEYPTKYVERPAYEDLLLCQKYYQLIWVYSWAYYDEASRALYFFVPTAVPPYNGTYCKKTIKLNKSPKFVVDGVEYECKGANYKYKALYPNGVLVMLSVDDLVGTSLEGVVFETGKQYYIYGGNFYLEGEQY